MAGLVVLAVVSAAGTIAVQRASRITKPATEPAAGNAPSASPTVAETPGAASFADIYREVASGVIRVETTACDGGGVGSGFLIAPDLIATAAHVVDDAHSIVLRGETSFTTGTIVGLDRGTDLALVRAVRGFDGHVFEMSAFNARVGDDVASIGYPLGGAKSFTKGAVSAFHEAEKLLQTDTALNKGNSGGPLVDVAGDVVGVVVAKSREGDGIGYAVASTEASVRFAGWRASVVPLVPESCADPTGPLEITVSVRDDSASPHGSAVAALFETYATGVNTGFYDVAFARLSPYARSFTSFDEFVAGMATTYVFEVRIHKIAEQAAGRLRSDVSFTSVQDPVAGGTGQVCSRWHLDYTLVADGVGGWLIDRANPRDGSPRPC